MENRLESKIYFDNWKYVSKRNDFNINLSYNTYSIRIINYITSEKRKSSCITVFIFLNSKWQIQNKERTNSNKFFSSSDGQH